VPTRKTSPLQKLGNELDETPVVIDDEDVAPGRFHSFHT
jgi:hypothetical protein